MEENLVLCPACKSTKDKDIPMEEKHDMLVCPRCDFSIIDKAKSPLGRYQEIWQKNSEELFPLLRPPFHQDFIANPRLFFLYEDCYHTLLIGRFNASIVLMGVLLEAVMKERISLKLGKDIRGAYGRCLKILADKELMEAEDLEFLRNFKDNIRNPYQHVDDSGILKGIFVPVWPFQFKGGVTFEKLEKAFEGAKSGRLKPKMLPAANNPALRPVVKQALDRDRAIKLFDQVTDFLLACKIKYFKQKEYDAHHKRFKTGMEGIEHYEI